MVVEVHAEWVTPRELRVRLDIAPPFHINAHETGVADIPLIPTNLSLPDDAKAVVEYPPGEDQRFAFSEEPLRVYSGRVTLAVRFTNDRRGQAPVRMRLSYQACDDSTCLAPVTKAIEA